MNGYLQVGKIVNTHGVKGEVKVFPLTDDQRRFDDLKSAYLLEENKVEEAVVLASKIVYIENVKYFKDRVILKLKDFDSLEKAKSLKNHFLVIDRKDAVKLPDDTFFICDLIGCNVIDINNELLGKLKDIIQTGSNDVYIVKGDSGNEILIPALKNVVKSVDLLEKKIIVEIPEGLI